MCEKNRRKLHGACFYTPPPPLQTGNPIGRAMTPLRLRERPKKLSWPTFGSRPGFVTDCSYSTTLRSISLINFGLNWQ